ncbi:MAG: Gfo/Idh/MocA family oxidoreductase [Candidatus Brocadiia bacterium]|nr:MAG: Gfo/Idh/MocA family oxidoreductase [Candidatus Brocadiia bacterium]
MKNRDKNNISRRDFIKASAFSLAAIGAGQNRIFAAGSDKIRVGLIGCGDRGTGAAINCVKSTAGVEIAAIADVFQDKLDNSLAKLNKNVNDKVSVTKENIFVGFDAYEKLLKTDVDMIILATPPHFRPIHVKAAVEAGKHVFAEKPGAVDPVGVRSLIASGELAKQKGISIVVGTQQRRQPQYQEILRRIHDGQMGEIVGGQAYWHWNKQNWHFEDRQAGWSDMEWQIRCWPYFTWLSGDHIVEQHLHNMDIINWAIGTHPVSCSGMGGRQVRTGPEYGNIYDHFAVEYEYPNGVRVLSMSSQMAGGLDKVAERVVGTKGQSFTTRSVGYIEGQNAFKYEDKVHSGMEKEHADLIESIRQGKPINEAQQLAESTLTVLMGRMSAYTGRALSWDWVMKSSKLDLAPEKYELGDLPVGPVAMPGKTQLI